MARKKSEPNGDVGSRADAGEVLDRPSDTVRSLLQRMEGKQSAASSDEGPIIVEIKTEADARAFNDFMAKDWMRREVASIRNEQAESVRECSALGAAVMTIIDHPSKTASAFVDLVRKRHPGADRIANFQTEAAAVCFELEVIALAEGNQMRAEALAKIGCRFKELPTSPTVVFKDSAPAGYPETGQVVAPNRSEPAMPSPSPAGRDVASAAAATEPRERVAVEGPAPESSAGPRVTQAQEASARRRAVIKPILTAKKWTVNHWADRADVDFHTADDYLSGRKNPHKSTRERLAKALSIELSRFPS